MRYVLRVDGGGSKTACLAADEQGNLPGYGSGGPVNTNYVIRQNAVVSLSRAIQTALAEAGMRGEQIETLCISAPIEPRAVEVVMHSCRLRHVIRAAEGETPRWAARFWINERVGVTVDAGTGSLARGWAADGREASAGGWGSTLGDEGSGYWIGLQALIAVLQAQDGRIENTSLTSAVFEHFGMSDAIDMVFRATMGLVQEESAAHVGVVHDSGGTLREGEAATGGMRFRERSSQRPLTRDQVASLCPVVAAAARHGDRKAVEILREAGYEIGRLGQAVVKRLGMEKDEFAVVPFGGVFGCGELVLEPFRETILTTAARAKVVRPQFEPMVGSVLLALNDIGVPIDGQVLAAIERGSNQFPACRALNEGTR